MFKTYLDRIPIFTSEGVLRSLLEPFLALGKAFVPATDFNNDRIIERCASRSREEDSLSDSHECGMETPLTLENEFCGQIIKRSITLKGLALSALSWFEKVFAVLQSIHCLIAPYKPLCIATLQTHTENLYTAPPDLTKLGTTLRGRGHSLVRVNRRSRYTNGQVLVASAESPPATLITQRSMVDILPT